MLGTQNAQWIDRIDDEIKVDGHRLQVKKAADDNLLNLHGLYMKFVLTFDSCHVG